MLVQNKSNVTEGRKVRSISLLSPPLIKIKVVLDGKLEVSGVYDSGSNVSLINSRLLKINNKEAGSSNNTHLKTINDVNKTSGTIKIDTRILNIEKKITVFVIDERNFDYDFLIGLDCIKEFQLTQDEDLIISQKEPEKDKTIAQERGGTITEDTTNNNSGTNDCHKIEKNQTAKDAKYLVSFNENFEEINFSILINHLEHEKQSKINGLINENATIFAKDKYDIGTVSDFEAHIDLSVERYCSKRPYRCSVEDRKEIESQIA